MKDPEEPLYELEDELKEDEESPFDFSEEEDKYENEDEDEVVSDPDEGGADYDPSFDDDE
jgi:hypothetical protein